METRGRAVHRVLTLVALAVLLAAWEAAPRLLGDLKIYFPPASQVLAALARGIVSGALVGATAETLRRAFLGLLLALAVGVPMGVLMGLWSRVSAALTPAVESLRPIPSAAMIPVALLFLGIGERLYLAVIAFGCCWPILLNTLHGVRSTDPLLVDTGRTLNLSRPRIVGSIVLPSAMPQIATGVRISLAISLILAITVEMITGSSGLGYLILDAERSFRYREMYAGIVLLGVVGLLINQAFHMLSRRFLGWAERAVDVI